MNRETIARNRISIGHDVWLGKNALSLPRVSHIGNGTVIGTRSVVAGDAARIIKYRLPPAVSERIDESRRRDGSIEELRLRLAEFFKPVLSKYWATADSSRCAGLSPK